MLLFRKVLIVIFIKNTMLWFEVHFILMTCDKGFCNVMWIPLSHGHRPHVYTNPMCVYLGWTNMLVTQKAPFNTIMN